ncbi:chaplin family protein [Nocardiopsis mangrovi]|uniref:Chaplin family protein n=1 Tax=Nocardiopsis mangrovi TaxID=1179818 RepID=A0ABV9E1T9_9ACTN
MRIRFSSTASVALVAAGLVGGASAVASADPATDGSGGVLSGNQISVPADVEAGICGDSLAVLGISQAQCTDVSRVLYAAGQEQDGGPRTDGSAGIASGNQIDIPVDAAVDVCGNSAAIGGVSEARCIEIAEKLAEESAEQAGGDAPRTDGSGGVLSGNQISIPVNVAVNVCGNSISVLGVSEADCTAVVDAIEESPDNGGGPRTDGSGGAASGNQITVPVDVAVPICGNAVSVVGISEAGCLETISEEPPGDGGGDGGDGSEGEDDDGGDRDPQGGSGEDGGDGDGERPPGDSGTGSGADGGDGDPATPTEPVADTAGPGGLPMTGAALGGLVAAGLAALGGGAGVMYAVRRRRAAAGTADADGVRGPAATADGAPES